MGNQFDGPTVGFLLEQTLGHVSHTRNLRHSLAGTADARISWNEIDFPPTSFAHRVPPLSNWTVRASLAARRAVREMQTAGPLDGLFVHTHVPATFLGSIMKQTPTVVSIDATPIQIDSLGSSYDHPVQGQALEGLKGRLHRACFQHAAGLVAWSQWAADSLVADYGADADRLKVIPPGVILSQWERPTERTGSDDTVRILFVGGDLDRKGGHLLIDAVDRLRNDAEILARGIDVELHLVTKADVDAGPHVHVHHGLTPNHPELIALYHRSDIFALPTRGDCTPLVLAEAAAAGLPSIATAVGAIAETVLDGETGAIVEPTVESLVTELRPLLLDPALRRRLGANAKRHAAETMDAEKNASRLLDFVVENARPEPSKGRVVLTVSGDIAAGIEDEIATGDRPLADYVAIARECDAELLDRPRVRAEGSAFTSTIERFAGPDIAMAYHLFRRRRHIDVVITDGEQIGMPLAGLVRLFGRGGLRHVMIGHRLSVRKKAVPIRLLGLARGVDEVLVYSTIQQRHAEHLFHRPGQRVQLIDFMVDADFFRAEYALDQRPTRTPRPVICSAGRELRDYPTLVEAVRDIDVDLVIASASPWSKRDDNAHDVDLPSNVTVTSLTQKELRDLMERSDAVVMPLLPNDFQAGVTTILEAMAMERPVICTATIGQIDVVEDGVNGIYVPVGDVGAMRRAIEQILASPADAAEMGRQGRKLIEERADVRAYAATFARFTHWHLANAARRGSRRRRR